MYTEKIPENITSTTFVKIKYDCDGGFERCGKEWQLKYKDAQKNFVKNNGKHKCRSCTMSDNNPMLSKEVQDKIKQTTLEKYGVSCVLNTKENTKNRVESMFGTEEATQAIVEKRRSTSIKRYGADHIMKTDEGKKRLVDAMQQRYGVDNPMQVNEIIEKSRKTSNERYGVDNPMQTKEVQNKLKKVMMKKYGVEYYNQLPEMKDYLRENCQQWLKESWENGGHMKGKIRPEEWNQKLSDTISKLVQEGKWKSGPKNSIKGYYQSNKCKKSKAIFRSSYELKAHFFLDESEKVEWYDYEPFRIPYYNTEGKKRYYFVDFVFKIKDKEKLVAVEVKNNYTKDSNMNKAKYKAFQEQCDSVIDLEIWSNEIIKEMNMDIDKLKSDPRVELWKDN